MPQIALDALEAGLEGPATLRLAILERPTYFQVAEVLPRAMKELGLTRIPKDEAALRIAKRMAKEILQSGGDPLNHLRDFESLWIRSDHSKEVAELGNLDDDVWIAESAGKSEAQIRKWLTAILTKFAHGQPDL